MALLTRWLTLCAALYAAVLLPAPARSEVIDGKQVRMIEHKIKAGLLYNFLKYVEWPEDQSAAASVCIFGDDPFEGSLAPLTSRTVNQRPITLRRLSQGSEIAGCHLLFINAEERDRWTELQTQLAGKSVLTVSEFDDFLAGGGMIQFGRDGDRIEVTINLPAVSAAHLHVQDRLLKLATVVRGTTTP